MRFKTPFFNIQVQVFKFQDPTMFRVAHDYFPKLGSFQVRAYERSNLFNIKRPDLWDSSLLSFNISITSSIFQVQVQFFQVQYFKIQTFKFKFDMQNLGYFGMSNFSQVEIFGFEFVSGALIFKEPLGVRISCAQVQISIPQFQLCTFQYCNFNYAPFNSAISISHFQFRNFNIALSIPHFNSASLLA